MINHVRTLLLNIDGTDKPSYTYPGEEYVPLDFKKVVLSPTLKTLHAALFGMNPDRAMRNYRLAQYLTLLHKSSLSSYLSYFDKRITYWPAHTNIYDLVLTTPTITSLRNTDVTVTPIGNMLLLALNQIEWAGPILPEEPKPFFLHGYTGVRKAKERLYRQWTITVVDNTSVRVDTLTPPADTEFLNYQTSPMPGGGLTLPFTLMQWTALEGGTSAVMPLPDVDNLSFSFQNPIPGDSWQVDLLQQPEASLSNVVATLEAYYENEIVEILNSRIEAPYSTFYNIWLNKRQSAVMRLGSVVLGLAYRMNELI